MQPLRKGISTLAVGAHAPRPAPSNVRNPSNQAVRTLGPPTDVAAARAQAPAVGQVPE